MIYVERFYNKFLTSNTYFISRSLSDREVWIIDIVSSNIIDYCSSNGIYIRGALITHVHYDHIIGLRRLIEVFPEIRIYVSNYGVSGLSSSKINLSYYHSEPIEINEFNNVYEVTNCLMEIFPEIHIGILETPGHNPGSISFYIDNYLFTGDSYIPFTKVVTKLPGGDKPSSRKSLLKLRDLCTERTIICPGHGEMMKFNDTDLYGNIDSLV